MTDLSIDEQTVLLIAAEGERLIPIGRWKEPIDSLFAKGLLVRERHPGDPTGHFNNILSPQGRAAVDEMETGYDKVLAGAITTEVPAKTMAPLVIQNRKRLEARLEARLCATAEHIAAQVVELTRESLIVTGGDERVVLENWCGVIVLRAKEMVK